jgi:hypothetical protein
MYHPKLIQFLEDFILSYFLLSMERLTTISINLRFLWDLTKIKKKKSFGNFAHEPQEDDKNANFHRLLFAKFQKCVNYIMTNQGKCNTFFCQTYTSAKFF